MSVYCDIVLPVYNTLAYLRNCIDSVNSCTNLEFVRLVIVDDGSDCYTKMYLEEIASVQSHTIVHRNAENLGFIKSCNIGICLGTAPYVLLLNSDVVVTPGWLERLLECIESDTRIASVNPLTNHASQINVPMAPGANFYGMDWVVRKKYLHSCHDVVTGVGFCLLLRRSVLNEVGVFDEIYGRGYCEESDLCMRLTTSGWRTVVADSVYVYHKGSGSFVNREERYLHNRRIFDSRWKHEYRRQFREFERINPLGPTRKLFRTNTRWEPMPIVWKTARSIAREWKARSLTGVAKEALCGGMQALKNRRDIGTPESVAKVTRPDRLRVTYVLKDLLVAGGVLSVVQLVNELILLGVEARIVALFEDSLIFDWTPLYTRPIIFRKPEELIADFPESDIVVATLWATAPWVAEIVRLGKAKASAYFIQDYEAWFFPENDSASRASVQETYGLIDHRIVKSDWLQGMLANDGYPTNKIRLGMDLAKFYPRDVKSHKKTVLAMARPGTPRRGFKPTIEALALVKKTMPSIQIVLFGSRGLEKQKIPFVFRNEDIVKDQERLAMLYSEADVFLDGSDFQGFGRCALEAMACGSACVVTGVGGVIEYAKHGENCLVVSPKQPRAFAYAVLRILEDPALLSRLIAGAKETVKDYCHKREAKETRDYFQQLIKAVG